MLTRFIAGSDQNSLMDEARTKELAVRQAGEDMRRQLKEKHLQEQAAAHQKRLDREATKRAREANSFAVKLLSGSARHDDFVAALKAIAVDASEVQQLTDNAATKTLIARRGLTKSTAEAYVSALINAGASAVVIFLREDKK
jgi:hypothetical protein